MILETNLKATVWCLSAAQQAVNLKGSQHKF